MKRSFHVYDISQIMDDIASGLIDDPIEDYKYLLGELEKYRSHELFEAIGHEIANIMFGELPTADRKELTASQDGASFSFMLDQAEHFIFSGQWDTAGMILQNLIGDAKRCPRSFLLRCLTFSRRDLRAKLLQT